jgi:formylglycine-generating enzyme required for sulfatase activity
MMNFDVFISYPHEDKAAADAVCAALEADGIRCWIAPRDVRPGAEWAAAIVEAIDHCRAMVLIFSSSANRSKQIHREVQRAFDKEVPVLPLRIENIVPQSSLAYYMGPVHWLDALTPPLEQHLHKLAASVRALVLETRSDGDSQEQRRLRETEARRRAEDERRRKKEADERQADNERLARETQVKQRAEEKDVEARQRIEEERRKQEAEEEERKAEEERLRNAAEARSRRRKNVSRTTLAIGTFLALLVCGIVGVILYQSYPTEPVTQSPVNTARAALPLSPERERVLKPKDTFKECTACPELIVVPAGNFTMGSPDTEPERNANESPQHGVTIAKQFAVSRFAVTFDEWDACVADGGCNAYKPSDQHWGRGRRPVIYVSYGDTQTYLKWLTRKTGKPYRLLSEAEFEYAARAGTKTTYYWGDKIGQANANCGDCGSQWDNKGTAPVGSFAANSFGLYDMAGNVWEWVEDCYKRRRNNPSLKLPGIPVAPE